METPTNRRLLRPPRNPTPRLSERKKKLFEISKLEHDEEGDESELLQGIQPLKATRKGQNGAGTPRSKNSVENLLSAGRRRKAISFFEEAETDESSDTETMKMTTVRRSPRLRQQSSSSSSPENNKENRIGRVTAAEEQLPHLFTSSMCINGKSERRSSVSHSQPNVDTPKSTRQVPNIVIDETSSEDDEPGAMAVPINTNKRLHASTESVESVSPQRKIYKTDVAIPTKSFYSKSNSPSSIHTSPTNRGTKNTYVRPETRKTSPRYHRVAKTSSKIHRNRGVRHGIRKSITSTYDSVNVDQLLSQMHNEKLRKLIITKREEKKQIEKVHDIFRNAKDPIQMARPLSALNINNDNNNNTKEEQMSNAHKVQFPNTHTQHLDLDFSDIEQSDDSDRENEKITHVQNEEIIPLIRHEPSISPSTHNEVPTNDKHRKFFKSGRRSSTHMEVKITDTIRASVCNGKISLVQQNKRKTPRLKVKSKVTNEFSAEQATVEAILRNLDDTAFGDVIEAENNQADSNQTSTEVSEVPPSEYIDEDVMNNDAFGNFRNRLPYNTNDPTVAEQQHLLLDFLISNNICTEENFDIFIGNPENADNKVAASRIVDQIVLVVNEQEMNFRKRIPYNTSDPATIKQQEYFLDILIKNNMLTDENFDIFIGNFEQRKNEAFDIIEVINGSKESLICKLEETEPMQIDAVVANEKAEETIDSVGSISATIEPPTLTVPQQLVPAETLDFATNTPEVAKMSEPEPTTTIQQAEPVDKLFPIFSQRLVPFVRPNSIRKKTAGKVWKGGDGADQYQIDAGQKQFGHHQCKQCGLVYTAHEPEEEKLHRDYHESTNLLRFSGWIDEDIVGVYPEWAYNGRIIRLNERSHTRRIERLKMLLSLADKELGSTGYKIPDTFVAYIAVRKNKITGVCVVEPLLKARRYIYVDGVDFCSEEEYDVKCGVSRIWVCPLNRRMHIGSKLIRAVQLNTIPSEDIPIEQIAFSSPSDDGKAFAQKLTHTEHFLVYQ